MEERTEHLAESLGEFAKRWATITAELAVYPSTNRRVQQLLDEVITDAHAMLESERDRISIVFEDERLVVAGRQVPFDGTGRLGALRDRLLTLGVAGISMLRGITREELQQVAELLNHRGPESEIRDQLAAIEHVSLRALMFDAGAKSSAGTEDGDLATGGAATSLAAELLAAEPELRAALGRLETAVQSSEAAARGPTIELDVLSSICDVLPAEAKEDVDAAARWVREAVDQVADSIGRSTVPGGGALTNDFELKAHLRRAALETFARVDGPEGSTRATRIASPSKAEPKGPIDPESIEGLLRSIESLPTIEDEVKLLRELESPAERLDTMLFTLLRTRNSELERRVHDHVEAALRSHPLVAQPLIEKYFDDATSRDDTTACARLARLSHVNVSMRRNRRVRRIEPEWVEAGFPDLLLPFLDRLKIEFDADRRALVRACKLVGGPRIIASAGQIVAAGGLRKNDRGEKILAAQDLAAMPLWHVYLEEVGARGAAAVTQSILQLGLDVDVVQVIKLLDAARAPSLELLTAFTGSRSPKQPPAQVRTAAANALATYLEATRRDLLQTQRRCVALELGTEFRSPRLADVIRAIAKDNGLLGIGGEPKAAREAAKATLAKIRGSTNV